jgi:hypothetical protein
MELVIWTLREVIPHYPGMLAGGKYGPCLEHRLCLMISCSFCTKLFMDTLWIMDFCQVGRPFSLGKGVSIDIRPQAFTSCIGPFPAIFPYTARAC